MIGRRQANGRDAVGLMVTWLMFEAVRKTHDRDIGLAVPFIVPPET